MISLDSIARTARRSVPAAFLACASLLGFASSNAQAQATYTVLRSFSHDTDGSGPSGLQKLSDGNLYGVTTSGGAPNAGGTLFRVSPDGGNYTVLHVFSGGEAGSTPTGFTQGSDGNIYGATRIGGAEGVGLFYRCALDGSAFTVLYDCVDDETLATLPNGLTQAGDGNFYGTSNGGGSIDNGVVFRLTPAGVLTNIYEYMGTNGRGARDVLILGGDGNLYGTVPAGGTNPDDPGNAEGVFFRVTPSTGAYTVLHTFTAAEAVGSYLPLTDGKDGYFYAVSPQGGEQSFGQPADGSILRIASDGTTTVLHLFQSAVDDELPFARLTLGSDGYLYGGNQGEAVNSFPGDNQDKNGRLYRISTSGNFETLYKYPVGTAMGNSPTGPMVETTPGTFIGTTTAGGASGDGVIFKLVVSPASSSHPAFFNGEVALGQGVYYLAFPGNGNIFGYYEYLSDPHYIYHFDLGFEYVFDLGNGGVVFYDFKSNDYFYTSPTFAFPYLYDFGLQAFLYYYPDPTNPQRYNTNGVRYFYNFSTGQVISK